MAKDTLLEKAKAAPIQTHYRGEFSPDQLEALAIAWVQGEVSTSQARTALKRTGTSLYSVLATAVKRAVQAGRIKIV